MCVCVCVGVCVCARVFARIFFGPAPVVRCVAAGMKIKTSRLQRKFLQQHVPEALWTCMWHEAGALQVEVHAGVIWKRGGQSFLGPLEWLPTQPDQPSLCAKPIFSKRHLSIHWLLTPFWGAERLIQRVRGCMPNPPISSCASVGNKIVSHPPTLQRGGCFTETHLDA